MIGEDFYICIKEEDTTMTIYVTCNFSDIKKSYIDNSIERSALAIYQTNYFKEGPGGRYSVDLVCIRNKEIHKIIPENEFILSFSTEKINEFDLENRKIHFGEKIYNMDDYIPSDGPMIENDNQDTELFEVLSNHLEDSILFDEMKAEDIIFNDTICDYDNGKIYKFNFKKLNNMLNKIKKDNCYIPEEYRIYAVVGKLFREEAKEGIINYGVYTFDFGPGEY